MILYVCMKEEKMVQGQGKELLEGFQQAISWLKKSFKAINAYTENTASIF